jgi:hypothetical protein
MRYPRAIFSFLFLAASLGGAAGVRADKPEKSEQKAAKQPAGAEAGEARQLTDAERKEIRDRVARGLRLVEGGDGRGALTEFERAYELAPSRLLLYHIASACAAMGKPIAAIQHLDALLAEEGPLKPEYLEKARALKEEQQQQVGQLDVKVNVPADILVDGARVGEAPLEKPIQVATGQHVVSVVAEGHIPQYQSVSLAGSGLAEAVFELKPMEGELAYVKIYSAVPAVEATVDDVSLGKTPFAEPVALAPGKHVFELHRPGYMTQRRELKLTDGAHASIAFQAEEDQSDSEARGRLVLDSEGGGVTVSVDGRSRGVYRKPIALPAGPHFVKLEQDGFEPMEQTIIVPRGGEIEVKVGLRSTGAKEAVVASRRQTYQHWAIASLITGAVVAGGSLWLAIWSHGQLPGPEANLATVQKDSDPAGSGSCSHPFSNIQQDVCDQRLNSAQAEVDKYKNLRLGGGLGTGLGVVLMGVGVTLLIIAPDTPADGKATSMAGTLVPILSAGPEGASFGLRGRF